MIERLLKTAAVLVMVCLVLKLVARQFGWDSVINTILVIPFVIGAAVLGLMALSLLRFVITGEF
jgi:ABC-type sulfate transport system permease component